MREEAEYIRRLNILGVTGVLDWIVAEMVFQEKDPYLVCLW